MPDSRDLHIPGKGLSFEEPAHLRALASFGLRDVIFSGDFWRYLFTYVPGVDAAEFACVLGKGLRPLVNGCLRAPAGQRPFCEWRLLLSFFMHQRSKLMTFPKDTQ